MTAAASTMMNVCSVLMCCPMLVLPVSVAARFAAATLVVDTRSTTTSRT
jgi:hypothetical protein